MKTLVWVLIIFTNQGIVDLGQYGVFRDRAMCEQVLSNLKDQEEDIEAESGKEILDMVCMPGEITED